MGSGMLFHMVRSQTHQRLASKNLHSGYHPCRFGTQLQTAYDYSNINSATKLAIAQKRWASRSTAAEDNNKISIGPRKGGEVEENEEELELFIMVQSQVLLRKWQPGSDTFDVEMLSWLASHIPKTIKFSDIRPPETNRPFVTFKANRNFYFVDAEHCHNKALLARLTPQK